MISKDMTIGDVIRRYPATISVFERYGLDCHDCQIADFEAVEHGASVHNVDVDALVAQLNSKISL